MKPARLVVALALTLVLPACTKQRAAAPEPEPSVTQAALPELLVNSLPPEIEGVKLTSAGLELQKGWEFVKDSDSTFVIQRMDTGRRPGGRGGCGCRGEGGCDAVLEGGIIVCKADSCAHCGLRLDIGGRSVAVLQY